MEGSIPSAPSQSNQHGGIGMDNHGSDDEQLFGPEHVSDNPKRQPLGSRSAVVRAKTVKRITGEDSKGPVLDVAAFQSFAD